MADNGGNNDGNIGGGGGLSDAGSTPTSIFLEGENLRELSMVQQGFIRVIRGIETESTDSTTAGEVKAMVVQAYPPEMLFDPELASYPRIYIKLRNWFDKYGAALGDRPSRRVYNLLADRLYTLDADREQAKELARKLQN